MERWQDTLNALWQAAAYLGVLYLISSTPFWGPRLWRRRGGRRPREERRSW